MADITEEQLRITADLGFRLHDDEVRAIAAELLAARADLREAVALLDGWAQPSGHVAEWNRRVGALLAKHKETP